MLLLKWHNSVFPRVFPAPKTYSLANTSQVDTGGVTDKSILKVSRFSDITACLISLSAK